VLRRPWVEYRFAIGKRRSPSIRASFDRILWRFGLQGRWEARVSQVEPVEAFREGSVSTSHRAGVGAWARGCGRWRGISEGITVSSAARWAVRLDLGTTWGSVLVLPPLLGGTANGAGYWTTGSGANGSTASKAECGNTSGARWVREGFELGTPPMGRSSLPALPHFFSASVTYVLSRYGVSSGPMCRYRDS
jgi:hypothetical protein